MYQLVKVNDEVVEPIPVGATEDVEVLGAELFPEAYSNIYVVGKRGMGKSNIVFKILENCTGPKTKVVRFVKTKDNDDTQKFISEWLDDNEIWNYSYNSIFGRDESGKTFDRVEKMYNELIQMAEKKQNEKVGGAIKDILETRGVKGNPVVMDYATGLPKLTKEYMRWKGPIELNTCSGEEPTPVPEDSPLKTYPDRYNLPQDYYGTGHNDYVGGANDSDYESDSDLDEPEPLTQEEDEEPDEEVNLLPSDDEDEEEEDEKEILYPMYIFVFDDISSELKRCKILEEFLKQGRHFKAKIIIASQYWNDLKKEGRENLNYALLLGHIPKEKVEEIRKELSLDISEPEFYEMYKEATKNHGDFLYIDCTHNTFRMNFDMEFLRPEE